MGDMTFCASSCPLEDCERHISKLLEMKWSGVTEVSMADFAPVCRRYMDYVVDNVLKEAGRCD